MFFDFNADGLLTCFGMNNASANDLTKWPQYPAYLEPPAR
jgi:hypothetical protein